MLDAEYLKTLVKKAAEFGNGKIHIIVNNAGYTWDGVIHKVNLLQYNMGLRYLADWEMLDSKFLLREGGEEEEEEGHADLVPLWISTDYGQTMGEYHCSP